MRILQLTMDYPPPLKGGLQRQVQGLVQTLKGKNHDVCVLTLGEDRADGSVPVFGAPGVDSWLPQLDIGRMAKPNLGLCTGLAKAFCAGSWDVIHAHDWMVAPAAVLARHTFDVPVIASFHADSGSLHVGSDQDRERRLEWERALIRVSDRSIACGSRLTQLLQHRHPQDNIVYIPNGIQTEIFRQSPDYAEQNPLKLLFVGRLVPYKGCQDLIRAVAVLKSSWPALELQIVGDGFYHPQLEELTDTLDLRESISFTGWLEDEELLRAYQSAAVIVIPSHEEAFGLVALEAMAAGTPVIATTVGAFPDIIDDGATGILTPPDDVDALIHHIRRLLLNPQLGREMAESALELVVPRYDFDLSVEQTLHLYKEVATAHLNSRLTT